MKRIKKPSEQLSGMKTRLCTECRTVRLQYGYTQAYIAKIAGVDCSMVSRFEGGQYLTLQTFLAYIAAMPKAPWNEIIDNMIGGRNESETSS